MTKKILVVEDDADTQLGLKLRLEAHGYEVAFASDGATAILQARREEPDLILLDLGLPAGDGHIVMERLKKNNALALIPVIVLTAGTGSLDRRRAVLAGASAYFTKPFSNDDLLNKMACLLGGTTPSDAAPASEPEPVGTAS